jgi:DNA polymerase III psi subunit
MKNRIELMKRLLLGIQLNLSQIETLDKLTFRRLGNESHCHYLSMVTQAVDALSVQLEQDSPSEDVGVT